MGCTHYPRGGPGAGAGLSFRPEAVESGGSSDRGNPGSVVVVEFTQFAEPVDVMNDHVVVVDTRQPLFAQVSEDPVDMYRGQAEGVRQKPLGDRELAVAILRYPATLLAHAQLQKHVSDRLPRIAAADIDQMIEHFALLGSNDLADKGGQRGIGLHRGFELRLAEDAQHGVGNAFNRIILALRIPAAESKEIAGKAKIENLPAAITEHLVAEGPTVDEREDLGRWFSLGADPRPRLRNACPDSGFSDKLQPRSQFGCHSRVVAQPTARTIDRDASVAPFSGHR